MIKKLVLFLETLYISVFGLFNIANGLVFLLDLFYYIFVPKKQKTLKDKGEKMKKIDFNSNWQLLTVPVRHTNTPTAISRNDVKTSTTVKVQPLDDTDDGFKIVDKDGLSIEYRSQHDCSLYFKDTLIGRADGYERASINMYSGVSAWPGRIIETDVDSKTVYVFFCFIKDADEPEDTVHFRLFYLIRNKNGNDPFTKLKVFTN